MSDLIERQSAINTAQVMYERCEEDIEDYRDLMVESLKVLPSAQPEIIRCKDCKHYETHGHRCKVWNHGVIVMGYCYRAERSTDE